MAILDRLARKQGFTKTEEALANYVLHHAEAVAGMNIGELASAAYVSNASIVRLCRKVGVEGYRDFRIQLSAELERLRTYETRVNADTPFLENQSTRTIMSSVTSLLKLAIDQCYATVSPDDVDSIARLIIESRRVALYAGGDSAISCEAFANLLLKIGIICDKANQYGDPLVVSCALGPSDLAIFVTYSGSLLKSLSGELEVLRCRCCKMAVISSDASIPERMAGIDAFVALPEGEPRSGKIATYYAQQCIRYVLDCVYGTCFSLNYRTNMDRVNSYYSHGSPPHRSSEEG